MRKPISWYVLVVLFFFLSLGALFGGWSLMTDPSGGSIQLPLDYIHTSTSPFNDYLIPGLILFLFNGIFPLFIIYGFVKRPNISFLQRIIPFKKTHWAWTLSGILGVGLVLWIVFEIIITQMYYPPLQLPFAGLGMIIILLTLMPKVKKYFAK
jgi:hypothetical protein